MNGPGYRPPAERKAAENTLGSLLGAFGVPPTADSAGSASSKSKSPVSTDVGSVSAGDKAEKKTESDKSWATYLARNDQPGSVDMSKEDQLKMFGFQLDPVKRNIDSGPRHTTLCRHDEFRVDDEPAKPVDLKEACPGLFPMFSWEEGDVPGYIVSTGIGEEELSTPSIGVYHTSTTQIPGFEGMLVDTGAVEKVSGIETVQRMDEVARMHGEKVTWEPLPRAKHFAGVGDKAKTCTHSATIPGMLETGERMDTTVPVIPGSPSPPFLYGLKAMAEENTYMGTANGLMALVPAGCDDQIVWPQGTKFRQCRKAPSGHWILITSNWNKRGQTPSYVVSPGSTPFPTSAPPQN